MIRELFGNESAAIALLTLYHHRELHASAIAKDAGKALHPILNQLDRFESAGILISRQVGRSRLYSFNQKSPFYRPLMEILGIEYSSLSQEQKEILFKHRRPRRKGKPVKAVS